MSTTKVLILASLLRDRGGVARLNPVERADAVAAITASDNRAILALFSAFQRDRGGLGAASGFATGLLRDAGDASTAVATAPPPPPYVTTFGQTAWTPKASITFFRALARGCLLAAGDTSYLLRLMRRIEPSESWGLGSAGFSAVAFKGGWGPEPHGLYGVRQTGIIGAGDSGAVVSLVAYPTVSFATGQSLMTRLAGWLKNQLVLVPRPKASCSPAG